MIDIKILPAPQSVEALSFEAILSVLKTELLKLDPSLDAVLDIESETLVKFLQNVAYRELYLRQKLNDGIRATMITLATSGDLDHKLVDYGVARLIVQPEDATTIPPTPAVMESDADFRRRGLLAVEAFSTAGPEQGYVFHALSASPDVGDCVATSPSNGRVDIKIISKTGIASADLVKIVTSALNTEKVRPLGTNLTVSSATKKAYTVTATLHIDNIPESEILLARAKAELQHYANAQFKIGQSIYLSAITAALHQRGVGRVDITQPTADIIIDKAHFGKLTGMNITLNSV